MITLQHLIFSDPCLFLALFFLCGISVKWLLSYAHLIMVNKGYRYH